MKTIRYLENRFIILLSLVLRTLAFPVLLLYFLLRIGRDRKWLRKLAERFGALPASFSRTPPGAVWLHAVSVGEILSAVALLKQLRIAQPYAPLYVSTTTLAGRAVADDKLRGLASGVFYLPIDYGFAIRRVLRAIRPNVVVILETELWPTLFRTVTRAGCELLIVNGRISDRAWPRYRRLRWFFHYVLELPRRLARRRLSQFAPMRSGSPRAPPHPANPAISTKTMLSSLLTGDLLPATLGCCSSWFPASRSALPPPPLSSPLRGSLFASVRNCRPIRRSCQASSCSTRWVS
jgi:hypothetical protein